MPMKNHSSNGFFSVLLALTLCLGGVAQGAESPEDIFWRSVRKSDLQEEYGLYIKQYPKGKHLAEAWRLIDALEAEQKSAQAVKQEETRRRAEIDALRPGQVFKDCPECPEMVFIPAGNFDMGSNNGSMDEKPVHSVKIDKAFALARTEVTQGQWKAVMGNNPSYFSNCGDDCPVEMVSWNDAHDYVRKLSEKTGKKYRLPSEAEWEYACRAGGKYEYCGGDSIDNVAWLESNSYKKISPVGTKIANAWGLYDMSGNVWEWVEDCSGDNYSGALGDGNAPSGVCKSETRVLRGGSWYSKPMKTRATSRNSGDPTAKTHAVGFRPAKAIY